MTDHPTSRSATGAATLPVFLAITFGWAWGLWGYWVVAMPPGGLQISAPFIVCAILGGLAPTIAALVVSAAAGRGEIGRRLLVPLRRWRGHGAALGPALLLMLAAVALSLVGQALLIGPLRWPDPALVSMALVWPVLAALGEEPGWRGVLLPQLVSRFGLLPAALVVGIVWGLWHLPADYIALKGYGDWFWAAFVLNGPVVLTAHSILMAWLWKRTSGSLSAAVVYHAAITASAIAGPTAGSDGLPGVLAAAALAVPLWSAAGLLLVFRWRDFRA